MSGCRRDRVPEGVEMYMKGTDRAYILYLCYSVTEKLKKKKGCQDVHFRLKETK